MEAGQPNLVLLARQHRRDGIVGAASEGIGQGLAVPLVAVALVGAMVENETNQLRVLLEAGEDKRRHLLAVLPVHVGANHEQHANTGGRSGQSVCPA